METYEIDSASYWKNPFSALIARPAAVAFIIRDTNSAEFDVNESRAAKRNRFKFAEVEVQRASDVGVNDKTFFTYSHLGDMITYEDTVMGYDMNTANFSDDQVKILDNMKVS